MDARAEGLLDLDSGVRFGGAVAQTHDDVMRAWEIRHEARQRIIAAEVASKRDDVVAFRKRFLPDGLLPPDPTVIIEWLDARLEEAISHAVRLEKEWEDADSIMIRRRLRVDVGSPSMPSQSTYGQQDDVDIERGFNAFAMWGRGRVPPFTAVGELVQLGDTLQREFGWTAESARRWVIVRDAVPSTGSILETRDIRHSRGRDENGVPWHTWAELRVPLTFPSSRLSRQFERIRDAHEGIIGSAARPTSPENVALALFCVERNDGTRTWMDVLKLWNQQHADSRFEESRKGVHLFAKTVRKTYRAIMGEQLPLVWRTAESDD